MTVPSARVLAGPPILGMRQGTIGQKISMPKDMMPKMKPTKLWETPWCFCVHPGGAARQKGELSCVCLAVERHARTLTLGPNSVA